MIYLERDNYIYEVVNTENGEFALFSGYHKPIQGILIDICVEKEWGFKEINSLKKYIKKHIKVRKAKVYADERYKPIEVNPIPRRPNKKRCPHCGGAGFKMDDSYDTFGCPWCNGTGEAKET